MGNPTRTNSLGLNMWGASGYTSVLSTQKLFMKADISSGNLNLFTKNKPSGAYLQHDTNWDASLNSYNFNSSMVNNSIANSDLEFSWKDFSTNKNDTYFFTNAGKSAVDYTISANWNINDTSIVDDIAVVAVSDWTSTEKITLDTALTRSFQLYSVHTGKVIGGGNPEIIYFPVTYSDITVYTYLYTWFRSIFCPVTSGGTLSIQYDYNGSTDTVSQFVPAGDTDLSNYLIIPTTTPISKPVPTTFNGSPSGWPNVGMCVTDLELVSTDTYPVQNPIPEGAIQVGNQYYFPPDTTPETIVDGKTSRFIIPYAHFLFDKKGGDYTTVVNPSANITEYLDYSDIFIEIMYKAQSQSSAYTRTYKFDGYVTYDEFLSTPDTFNDLSYIYDDQELTWKILIHPNGYQFGVVLSSYSEWSLLYDKRIELGSYFNAPLPDSSYKVLDIHDVTEDFNIKIYKLVNFSNCGKVDFYLRATGTVESITSSTNIQSISHKLKTGDRIKITGGLSSSGVTNINGAYYVTVIDANSFYISYSSNGSAISIVNYNTLSNARWTKIGSSDNWNYNRTIYSPCGKNGYSSKDLQLLTTVESPLTAGDDLNERSVEYIANIDKGIPAGEKNYSPPGVRYPQGYFNGERSWNNFYPLERFDSADEIAYGVINGNHFGSSIAIKKYSSTEYILMVAESGASESFQMINFLPDMQNVRVIPTYLPYGRIHFYKITKSSNDIAVQYLKTINRSDNPWATYELNNKDYKLSALYNYENYSLTSDQIINSLNLSFENYWVGSRYVSWSKTYKYSTDYQAYLPYLEKDPYEFSFIDSLGRSAGFEIENNIIYCIASTTAKSANFQSSASSRINNLDAISLYFTYDLTTDEVSSLSSLISQDDTVIEDQLQQYEEYMRYSTRIATNGNKVFYGWPSKHKMTEYLYYYNRTGNVYTLKQLLTYNEISNFGGYIVSKGDFLLTNKLSYYDELNNLMTNAIDSIQVYKYFSSDDKYVLQSVVSPTINLNNAKYNNINSLQYQLTANLSYDGTRSNSASYIMYLDNRYDLQDNLLFLRDWNEISCFIYNDSTKAFENRFHEFVKVSPDGDILNSDTAVLRVGTSLAAATFDNVGETDYGQFSTSLQIIDASRFISTSEFSYINSIDVQKPEYLSLFMKHIEGSSSGNINLFLLPNSSTNSGINTFLKVLETSTGNLQLNLQAPISSTGAINLYTYGKTESSDSIDLVIYSNSSTGNLNLFAQSDIRGVLPITVWNPSPVPIRNSEIMDLHILSQYTGVPNSSSVMPLNIATISEMPSAGYGQPMPLNMYNSVKPDSGNLDMTIYVSDRAGTTGTFGSSALYLDSTGNYTYSKYNSAMPLNIAGPIAGALPLVVYNNTETNTMNLFMSGIPVIGSGLNLVFGSGYHRPSQTRILFTRGTTLK